MGKISVDVTVANVLEPEKHRRFVAVVDTGAFGLILPRTWKDELGPFADTVEADVETADQRVVVAEICGPVRVQVDGFRRIIGEAVFLDMQPGPHGYEPLVGYTVLELSGVLVDMVDHRLVAKRTYDVKIASWRRAQSGTATASAGA